MIAVTARVACFAAALLQVMVMVSGCDGAAPDAARDGEGALDTVPDLPTIAEDVGEDVPPADTGPGPAPVFRIAFASVGRPPDHVGQRDTALLRSDGTGRASLGALVRSAGEAAGCDHDCVVAPDGTWLAAATTAPAASGSAYRFGRLAEDGSLSALDLAVPLADVTQLRFAGDRAFFTRLVVDSPGTERQYTLHRTDPARPAEAEVLARFPPDDALVGSDARGHFHPSRDGSTVVLLRPTLRSQTIYAWRDGAGESLLPLDRVCWRSLAGACSGAGMFYADDDPVAVSDDGRQVAAFVVADGALELRHYRLDTDPPTPSRVALARAPDGEYDQAICGAREPWQPAFVVGRPWFTPSGDVLLFVGFSDCGAAKPETDVLRVEVERVLAGGDLVEADVHNLTRTPKEGGPTQLVIEDLALAPGASALVLVASPTQTGDGSPIPDGSARHANDRELWVAEPEGAWRRQLTDEPRFLPVAPVAF